MHSRTDADAHIKALQALCEQAEVLRRVAEELCARLTMQMEHTRRSVHLPKKPEIERRRKARKHR
jgi:hypothetical protein